MTTLQFDEWQDNGGTPVLRINAGALEVWDGSAWATPAAETIDVDFLVIAGGGAGGTNQGGGGGAGGYRCSVSGESSGGGNSAESALTINAGATIPVLVGAGGVSSGLPSQLGHVVSVGGGRGGWDNFLNAADGGSGGGGRESTDRGLGFANQGFNGGNASNTPSGGGGASEAGDTDGTGHGGDGIESSITGSAVTRAGGGAGGSGTPGAGGGGTGRTGSGQAGSAGTVNTGSGGGGGGSASGLGGNGGSGIVIFSVPTGTTVAFSSGVTESSSSVGANDIYTVTATSTASETVTIGDA